MTKAIDVVRACKQCRVGRLTAYDISDSNSTEFVLGIKVNEEIDLWYISREVSEGGLYLGTPYWDAAAKILYFPRITIDAEAFGELCDAAG